MTEEKNKFQALDHGLGSVIRDPPIYKKTSQKDITEYLDLSKKI